MAENSDICTDRYSFFEILCVYLTILAKYQHTVFAAVHLERMEQIMRDNLSLGPLGEPDVRAARSTASRNALFGGRILVHIRPQRGGPERGQGTGIRRVKQRPP